MPISAGSSQGRSFGDDRSNSRPTHRTGAETSRGARYAALRCRCGGEQQTGDRLTPLHLFLPRPCAGNVAPQNKKRPDARVQKKIERFYLPIAVRLNRHHKKTYRACRLPHLVSPLQQTLRARETLLFQPLCSIHWLRFRQLRHHFNKSGRPRNPLFGRVGLSRGPVRSWPKMSDRVRSFELTLTSLSSKNPPRYR